jgi:hypothetical protein
VFNPEAIVAGSTNMPADNLFAVHRDESGLCTTFFVKNFGATDLTLGISRVSLAYPFLHAPMQIPS